MIQHFKEFWEASLHISQLNKTAYIACDIDQSAYYSFFLNHWNVMMVKDTQVEHRLRVKKPNVRQTISSVKSVNNEKQTNRQNNDLNK